MVLSVSPFLKSRKGMAMIQLYSLGTPNGQKVSIALEEMGMEYTPHMINIMNGDQFKEDFLKISPNNKIPAIVDEQDGLSLFESGAILTYLAEKTGMFLPTDKKQRYQTLQWLNFQMGGVGPMFGQFGHFYKYAQEKCDHPYPVERYTNEARRLLGVMDKQLQQSQYIAHGRYSIADMAIYPWIVCMDVFYNGKEHLKLNEFPNVNRWMNELEQREKLQKGMQVLAL